MPLTEAEELELLELEEEEYQQSLSQQAPKERTWGEFAQDAAQGVGDAALDALPIATGIGGTILGGSPITPTGIAAGAIGYGIGAQARRLIKERILGRQQKDSGNAITDLGEGLSQAIGGAIAGPVLSMGAKGLRGGAEVLAKVATGAKKASGSTLLDEGVIAPLRTRNMLQGRAKNVRSLVGEKLGDTVSKIQGNLSKEKILSGLDAAIDKASQQHSAATKLRVLKRIRKDLEQNPTKVFSPKKLEAEKTAFADRAKYNKKKGRRPEGAKAQGEMARIYREATEELASKSAPQVERDFLALKQKYSDLSDAAGVSPQSVGLAEDVAESVVKKGIFGALSDVAVGSTASTLSSGMNQLSKFVGGTGKAIADVTTRAAAPRLSGVKELMQNAPEQLQRYLPMLQKAADRGGDKSLAVMDNLLQQTDPEYQEIMKRHRESR